MVCDGRQMPWVASPQPLERAGTLKWSTLGQSAKTRKRGWWWYEFKEG